MNDSFSDLSDYDDDFVKSDTEIAARDAIASSNESSSVDDDIDDDELSDGEPADVKNSVRVMPDHVQEIIVIRPEERITSNVMSKYEMTEVVSQRATQIAMYNNCMVDITGLTDPIKMAKRELKMRMCPETLRRQVGELKDPKTGEVKVYYEMWCPNSMTFSMDYPDV
jgi:DNA-directed RNA polymerase subunit K/omega